MKTYLRLLSFAKPFGWSIPGYLISTILYSIFSVINLAVLIPILQVLFDQGPAVEVVQKPEFQANLTYFKEFFSYYFQSIINNDGKFAALQFVCLIVVVSFLLSNTFKYLSEIITITIKTRMIQNLRAGFFDKITNMHLGFFTDTRKGDIMSKAMSDVQEVENTITQTLKVYIREPFLLLAYFIALFTISAKLTLITLILLPLSGGFISYIARKLKRKAIQSQETLGRLNNILDEALSGIRIIKAFNAQHQVQNNFMKEVKKYAGFTFNMQSKFALASPVSEFLGIFVVVAIILIGGNMILEGDESLNASQFITFVAIFSQILNPAKALSNAFSSLQRGLAAGERIFGILDQESEIKEKPEAKTLDSFKEKIVFDNVSFAYEEDKILDNISFSISKGEVVALVGPSGGGKSTLADLLPRFYDIKSGSISIDGIELNNLTLQSLRQHFGIVSQESILFNDTVFNNIAFGKPNANKEDVEKAAKIAFAHDFIVELEDGYDTSIGERGNRLSGGQKQRISIARAILKDPAILILDEATSALDTASEKLVQEALSNLMKNRTALVIAHRLSTIQHADKIIVIEKGQIKEIGSHEELLKKSGTYKKLIELQRIER